LEEVRGMDNKETVLCFYMMNKRSSSSRTTTSVTAIAIASAILLVGTLAIIPLVEQAHALDLLTISDDAKSMVKGIRDIFGSGSIPGYHNPQ
jgi:hypothetical protein